MIALAVATLVVDTLPLPVGELASNQDRVLQFAI
jgi:hypothetical protein